jgi:hypothetical protein
MTDRSELRGVVKRTAREMLLGLEARIQSELHRVRTRGGLPSIRRKWMDSTLAVLRHIHRDGLIYIARGGHRQVIWGQSKLPPPSHHHCLILRGPRAGRVARTPTMKSMLCVCSALLLLSLSGLCVAGETRLSTPDGHTRAYIDDRGRISAPDGKTLGYIEPSGRISRPDGSTAGYLGEGREVIEGLGPGHHSAPSQRPAPPPGDR